MHWSSGLFGLQRGVLRAILLAFSAVGLGLTLGCSGGDGSGNSASTPVPSPSGGSPASIEVRNLGTVTLGPNGSSTEFVVDIRGTSFMLIADGGLASDIDIHSVVDPEGVTLVTPDRNDSDPIGRNNLKFADAPVAVGLFPHTPAYGIRSGSYKFKVHNVSSETQTITVSAVMNNRVSPTGGTLNVNLVFCGIPDISAATAFGGQSLASQRFVTMFNEFKRIYERVNIQIAVSGVFDCPAAEGARLTFLSLDDANGNGHPDDVEDLAKLTSNYPANAVTYFLVQDANGFGVYSGGIPGPALTSGTLASGVAVATFGPIGDLTPEMALIQGRTMAHEGGHYLGLFHTTERDALLTDPISDTPACHPARDTNHNGTVEAAECLDLDGTNLMFWGPLALGTQQDGLTEGQKFVLYRNPLIH